MYMYYVLFQWLKERFLLYLNDWEKGVYTRSGFSRVDQKKMLLPQETLHGLRMSGNVLIIIMVVTACV